MRMRMRMRKPSQGLVLFDYFRWQHHPEFVWHAKTILIPWLQGVSQEMSVIILQQTNKRTIGEIWPVDLSYTKAGLGSRGQGPAPQLWIV
jgi:hypothetical protein